MDEIVIPVNLESFRALVLEKIRAYCRTGIWPWNFDAFAAWLSNFEAGADEYVALQLIDSLIVRSEAMAIASYSKLFSTDLLQHLILKDVISSSTKITAWQKMLKEGRCQNIQFLPIRTEGDEGESGGAIFRELSKIINTNKLSKDRVNVGAIVLIDDFLGSGNQLSNFMATAGERIVNCQNVIYCPLMATSYGISNSSSLQPNIKIMPAEVVSDHHSLFPTDNQDAFFKNDTVNTIYSVKNHYEKMKEKYAGKNMPFWDGRDSNYLPIAFEWGCPNQTPSIFWMEHSNKKPNWQQLFFRRA